MIFHGIENLLMSKDFAQTKPKHCTWRRTDYHHAKATCITVSDIRCVVTQKPKPHNKLEMTHHENCLVFAVCIPCTYAIHIIINVAQTTKC